MEIPFEMYIRYSPFFLLLQLQVVATDGGGLKDRGKSLLKYIFDIPPFFLFLQLQVDATEGGGLKG